MCALSDVLVAVWFSSVWVGGFENTVEHLRLRAATRSKNSEPGVVSTALFEPSMLRC